MFVKTKERAGRTHLFLCIPERGGNSGNNWKTVEYSVSLGETLDLSSAQWEEILRRSPDFRSIPLEHILNVVEQYVAKHGLPSETLDGLREAVRGPKEKSRRPSHSERRSEEDEYTRALRLLGLAPGASDDQIESAFRKAARHWEPETQPAKRQRP